MSAKPYTQKNEALSLLKAQLVSPVLYKQSIKACEGEVSHFVEFGASVLTGLNKKITATESLAISNLNEAKEFIKMMKE